MKESLYTYKAICTAVYDGDTITVDIDLGMNIWQREQKIRLLGINTPEMRGADKVAGAAARDYLRSLVLNGEIIVRTVKDKHEKYGRLLGEIWIELDGREVNVNRMLLEGGYAVPYMVENV